MSFSSINPNVPAANTPISSSVVRSNFLAAYNDINTMYAQFSGISAVKMGNFFWSSPSATTISLIPYAEYNFTIASLNNLVVGSGSIVVSININGVPVTGLGSITVNSTPQNINATALNSVVAGSEVTLVTSSPSSPNNLKFTMRGTVP